MAISEKNISWKIEIIARALSVVWWRDVAWVGLASFDFKVKFCPGRCFDCLLLCPLLSGDRIVVVLPKHRFVAIGKIKMNPWFNFPRSKHISWKARTRLAFLAISSEFVEPQKMFLVVILRCFCYFSAKQREERRKTNTNQTVVKLQLLRHVSTVSCWTLLVPCSLVGWIPKNSSRPRSIWNLCKILKHFTLKFMN